MDSTIIVKGTAEVRVAPDLARVQLDVIGEASGRDDGYAEASRIAALVDAVLDAATLIAVTGTSLTVHPKTRWRKGESVTTGWRAERRSTVELAADAGVGELLAEVSSAGASIRQLAWVVAADNPAYATARRAAAEDARRRAEAYAEGLGLEVVAPAWVAEPGLRSTRPDEYGGGFALAEAVMGANEDPDETIAVVPTEVSISAAVEVAFTFA